MSNAKRNQSRRPRLFPAAGASVCTAQAADNVYDHAWLYVFSASMWTGQTLGDSLDLSGFIGSLILGGIILAIYTGSLAYVGAKTGLSLDLLAQHSFGAKGSYLPSVLTSFTQIGWFGVGVAMFAIPVAKLIAPENPWLPYLLVAIAGICMTGSAFFRN